MLPLPKHIAIIMDGNGRWAEQRMLPRVAGHHRGVESLRNIVQSCIDRKIQALTLFAFSSENWQRPKTEVKLLMGLLQRLLQEEVNQLHSVGVKLSVIGALEQLDPSLQASIIAAQELTQNNPGLRLNIALNYGGRWDIVQACKKICTEINAGKINIADINEQTFAAHTCLAGLPDPDLLIRTSGEQRISNFLLWQMAYTEIYFTPTLWPDFSVVDLEQALEFFSTRQRRFGNITTQQHSEEEHA